jgi:hypothetical protein
MMEMDVVRGEETRKELKEFGSDQGIRFVSAHFRLWQPQK